MRREGMPVDQRELEVGSQEADRSQEETEHARESRTIRLNGPAVLLRHSKDNGRLALHFKLQMQQDIPTLVYTTAQLHQTQRVSVGITPTSRHEYSLATLAQAMNNGMTVGGEGTGFTLTQIDPKSGTATIEANPNYSLTLVHR